MGHYEIVFYEKENGRIPVRDFLDSLPAHQRAKCLRDLEVLSEKGAELRPPASKHLRNGIFELRIPTSGEQARVFYFFYQNGSIVLTNGFLKKTQKTPPQELNRAIRYKNDWERRRNHA